MRPLVLAVFVVSAGCADCDFDAYLAERTPAGARKCPDLDEPLADAGMASCFLESLHAGIDFVQVIRRQGIDSVVKTAYFQEEGTRWVASYDGFDRGRIDELPCPEFFGVIERAARVDDPTVWDVECRGGGQWKNVCGD